jgi:hypothetical protein
MVIDMSMSFDMSMSIDMSMRTSLLGKEINPEYWVWWNIFLSINEVEEDYHEG